MSIHMSFLISKAYSVSAQCWFTAVAVVLCLCQLTPQPAAVWQTKFGYSHSDVQYVASYFKQPMSRKGGGRHLLTDSSPMVLHKRHVKRGNALHTYKSFSFRIQTCARYNKKRRIPPTDKPYKGFYCNNIIIIISLRLRNVTTCVTDMSCTTAGSAFPNALPGMEGESPHV